MPTAIIRPRPTAGLWSPIPSIRSAITSLHRAARLLFDRCATAPETRPLPAVSRTYPARDVDRLSSGVRRGGGGISRPVVRGPMAVVLPGSRCPVPPAILGVPLPTMLIAHRWHWGPVIGRERRRVRPVIAPPPLRVPAGDLTPDHAGKSWYLGEIDYRFLTFQTGSRF